MDILSYVGIATNQKNFFCRKPFKGKIAPKVVDIRLNYCIPKKNFKNKISAAEQPLHVDLALSS
jgi:hypothetical protein